MDTTALQSAIAAFKQHNDLSTLKTSLMAFFQIPSIAPELDAWLAGEEPPNGPYLLTSFERACEWVPSFEHLLHRFGEVPFPALNVGGDDGIDFWLVLETGRVISLHHDATFYEEAGYIKTDDISEFMRRFERVGSSFTFSQLSQLNALTADLDEGDDETYGKELLKATAQVLGISLRKAAECVDDSSMEIIYRKLGDLYDFPEEMEAFLDEVEPLES